MPFPISYSRDIEVAGDPSDSRVLKDVLTRAAAALRSNSRMEVTQEATAVHFRQRLGYQKATSNPPEPSCVSYPDHGTITTIADRERPRLRIRVGSYQLLVVYLIAVGAILGFIGRDLPWEVNLAIGTVFWLWLVSAFHVRRLLLVRAFLQRHPELGSAPNPSIPSSSSR